MKKKITSEQKIIKRSKSSISHGLRTAAEAKVSRIYRTPIQPPSKPCMDHG